MFLFVENDGVAFARALGTLYRLGTRGSKLLDSATRALDHLISVRQGHNPKPEAVILDLNLRVGHGLNVLTFMSQDPALRDIPVLIWTQSANETQREICLYLGAREFLIKTKDAKELKAAVLRLRQTPA